MHARRPEWGDGVVDRATTVVHEGRPAQRVIVRFAHQGLVTLNTGIAPLIRKDANNMGTTTTSTTTNTPTNTGNGWLGSLGEKQNGEELYHLPEAMTDPFASHGRRLQATLDSFRFGTDPREPRLLLDWAVAQTGLNDPLSKYTRHELEQAFPRFVRDRDNHLFELVKLMKRGGSSDVIQKALRETRYPSAKNALQRAIRD
jgi:hypothetical protein